MAGGEAEAMDADEAVITRGTGDLLADRRATAWALPAAGPARGQDGDATFARRYTRGEGSMAVHGTWYREARAHAAGRAAITSPDPVISSPVRSDLSRDIAAGRSMLLRPPVADDLL